MLNGPQSRPLVESSVALQFVIRHSSFDVTASPARTDPKNHVEALLPSAYNLWRVRGS
jgi:hypothetical protein